jgi:hypothetical protein
MSESRLRFVFISALSLASFLGSAEAFGQNAAELDKKARAQFDDKDYEGAARTFEEAYRLKPHPATQYNAALAWEKAGELARAADAFESALESEGLDEGRASASRERLAALKRQLGYVFVSRPIGTTVSVAHVEKLAIPAKIHLTPGKHEVVARRADGSTEKRTISVRAGESLDVAFEGESLGPGPAPVPEEPAPKTSPVVDEAPVEGSCSQCMWGWVAIGAGAVGAGVGTYFGLRTLSARDEFEDSNRTDADARDRAISSRTISNVGFGVAIVGVGVGVVLLLTAKDSKESTATKTELRIGPTGVSAALRF